LIKRIRGENTEKHVLHFDAGAFADFYEDGGETRTKAIIDAYLRIGIDAVNVTTRELGITFTQFEQIHRNIEVPFISANILVKDTGEPLFEPFLILKVGEKKIGVVGITDEVPRTWTTSDGGELIVADPVSLARPVIERLAGETDLIILLAYIPKWRIKEVAEALTGVDLILASDGVSATRDFVETGGSVACYAGRQGQYLGIVSTVTAESDEPVEMEYELKEITPDMPEDPDIKALVERAKAEISN